MGHPAQQDFEDLGPARGIGNADLDLADIRLPKGERCKTSSWHCRSKKKSKESQAGGRQSSQLAGYQGRPTCITSTTVSHFDVPTGEFGYAVLKRRGWRPYIPGGVDESSGLTCPAGRVFAEQGPALEACWCTRSRPPGGYTRVRRESKTTQ